MEHSKNKIKWVKWGVVGCFILVQGYLIFIDKHMNMDVNASPNTNPTPHILDERIVSQTFVSKRDHLAQIEVMLGTFGRENDKNVIFELGIPDQRRILRKVFNASEVENNLYHPIKFAPQKDSKGKKYYFALSSPESTLNNSICAWMNTKDIYEDGQYFFNHRIPGGDLVFRTYTLQPVSAVLGKINRNYPGIWGSPVFLILTVIFFMVLEVIILAKLWDLGYQSLSDLLKKKEEARV